MRETHYDKLVADRQRLIDSVNDIYNRVIPDCRREGELDEITEWEKDIKALDQQISYINQRLDREYNRLKRERGYIHCYYPEIDTISEMVFYSGFSWTKFFKDCKYMADYSKSSGVIYVVSPNGKKTRIRKIGRDE